MQEPELDESLTVVPTQQYGDIHWGMKISLPVEEVMPGPTKGLLFGLAHDWS